MERDKGAPPPPPTPPPPPPAPPQPLCASPFNNILYNILCNILCNVLYNITYTYTPYGCRETATRRGRGAVGPWGRGAVRPWGRGAVGPWGREAVREKWKERAKEGLRSILMVFIAFLEAPRILSQICNCKIRHFPYVFQRFSKKRRPFSQWNVQCWWFS